MGPGKCLIAFIPLLFITSPAFLIPLILFSEGILLWCSETQERDLEAGSSGASSDVKQASETESTNSASIDNANRDLRMKVGTAFLTLGFGGFVTGHGTTSIPHILLCFFFFIYGLLMALYALPQNSFRFTTVFASARVQELLISAICMVGYVLGAVWTMELLIAA